MGAAQSSAAAALDGDPQQLLERLSGAEPVAYAAPFWDQLFGFAKGPLASLSPEAVEEALAPHCRQLRECRRALSLCVCVRVCTRGGQGERRDGSSVGRSIGGLSRTP